MIRRRFFPASSVQTTPGQTVELEVQLSPAAPPASGGGDCTCDVLGVALFPEYQLNPAPESPLWMDDAYTSDTLYRPRIQDGRVTGGYSAIGWSNGNGLPIHYRFVVIGASLCSVAWDWALDVPEFPGIYEDFWGGVNVSVESGTLKVEVLDGSVFAVEPWWAEFRATATCQGEPVGTIVMRFGANLYPPRRLPPIV